MDQSLRTTDLHAVDAEIAAGFPLLRFTPGMERQFEADTAQKRCEHMIRQNYIAILIYHCFLYGDTHVIGDVFRVDLFMHFAVMTPLMIVTNAVLGRCPPAWLRESVEALAIAVLTLTIVAVVDASRLPNRDMVQWTIVLVILFATVMQRLRFWYAVAACGVAQSFFSLSLNDLASYSFDRTVMSNTIFAGILLFSLAGSYNFEHEQRMGYLLRLRDRLRNQELEAKSLLDALTGIANRHALKAAFERLLEASSTAPSAPTTVILLDIDHFKMFNDTHGHQKGDACLTQIAGIVAKSAHAHGGAAYRFGGEEFIVLMPDTYVSSALSVAEHIRSSVARAEIPNDHECRSFVTISLGVAAGHIGHDTAPDALIAAADAALYEAKRNGRDQVSVFREAGRDRTRMFDLDPQRLAS